MNKQYILSYLVKESDFSPQHKMNITIDEQSSVHGAITLGENVTCDKINPVTNEKTPLNTGAPIQETDYLEVKSSKTTGTWKVNEKKLTDVDPTNSTEFFVEKDHFSSGILKIEF